MSKSLRAPPTGSTAFAIAMMKRSRPLAPISLRSSVVVAGRTISAWRAVAVHQWPEVELFVVYGVMAVVLIVRPQGLFAPPRPRKI